MKDSKGISDVLGVLLAGGQARRMGGGDKSLLELSGRPLLSHAVECIRPQVGQLILNANGDPDRFERFGLPVVADRIDGFAGPLAGILTGMEWAAEQDRAPNWIATFATDAPFIPGDLVARLMAAVAAEDTDMACAQSAGRAHPVFALWPVHLRHELRRAMIEEGMRKIDLWTAGYNLVHVAFDGDGIDPFFNINRPENLAEAEAYLSDGNLQEGAA